MLRGPALPASIALAVVVLGGCVYPHRATSLSPVRAERADGSLGAPDDVWQVTFVEAQVRPRKSGDLSWDDNGGLPDVYVRFLRDGELLFETETIDDSLNPQWNAALERNVRLGPHTAIRIEVWDRDTVGSDPVGMVDRRGLPDSAVEGADARIMLEGGSYLTVRRGRPLAHRGVGIADYEIRSDRLIVGEVLPHSPAGRAGLQAGDEILAVGEQRIEGMNDGEATSAISLAASRHQSITFRRGTREETVDLDRGFVWLTM